MKAFQCDCCKRFEVLEGSVFYADREFCRSCWDIVKDIREDVRRRLMIFRDEAELEKGKKR